MPCWPTLLGGSIFAGLVLRDIVLAAADSNQEAACGAALNLHRI